ncbi:MAG: hypothetical protein RLP12_10780 [Ekhidna sp.]
MTKAQDFPDDQALSALVEIEQKIFSETHIEIVDSLLFIKAKIYKEAERFEEALKTLNRISNLSGSNLSAQVLNEKIKNNYFIKNHVQAKNLILETTFLDGYQKTKEIILFETLNYVALQELDAAERSFFALIADAEPVNETFRKIKFKSTEKAFVLSFIIPGSGQIYAGHPLKGVLSLSIQAPLFYFGLNGIQRGYIFTESIPSIALFQGFYFGGAEYAKELVLQRNQREVEELSLAILRKAKKEVSF